MVEASDRQAVNGKAKAGPTGANSRPPGDLEAEPQQQQQSETDVKVQEHQSARKSVSQFIHGQQPQQEHDVRGQHQRDAQHGSQQPLRDQPKDNPHQSLQRPSQESQGFLIGSLLNSSSPSRGIDPTMAEPVMPTILAQPNIGGTMVGSQDGTAHQFKRTSTVQPVSVSALAPTLARFLLPEHDPHHGTDNEVQPPAPTGTGLNRQTVQRTLDDVARSLRLPTQNRATPTTNSTFGAHPTHCPISRGPISNAGSGCPAQAPAVLPIDPRSARRVQAFYSGPSYTQTNPPPPPNNAVSRGMNPLNAYYDPRLQPQRAQSQYIQLQRPQQYLHTHQGPPTDPHTPGHVSLTGPSLVQPWNLDGAGAQEGLSDDVPPFPTTPAASPTCRPTVTFSPCTPPQPTPLGLEAPSPCTPLPSVSQQSTPAQPSPSQSPFTVPRPRSTLPDQPPLDALSRYKRAVFNRKAELARQRRAERDRVKSISVNKSPAGPNGATGTPNRATGVPAGVATGPIFATQALGAAQFGMLVPTGTGRPIGGPTPAVSPFVYVAGDKRGKPIALCSFFQRLRHHHRHRHCVRICTACKETQSWPPLCIAA